ncbi:MAG TPA: hypothetical protein DDZ81_24825 [Acetobacteraceae bacterium]|jgi:hypothetical protein|nr:hypothetical protein [Acetobacteraceae bacterium]
MISLFQSDANPGVFGFTRDATGQNLPARFAPWRKNPRAGSLFLGAGESSAQVGTGDPVIRAVETQGYYLVGTPPRQARYRHW